MIAGPFYTYPSPMQKNLGVDQTKTKEQGPQNPDFCNILFCNHEF